MLLDRKKIADYLSKKSHQRIDEIKIEQSVTSTNDVLLAALKQHPEKIIALLAEMQTAGRGRLGHTWISPPHTNIYLSLSWHFKKPAVQLSTLSLLIAEIMQHALKDFGIAAPIVIKPPNDLMVAHQKLGGILIDMLHHQKNACTAVIGIGLNVNLEKNEAIDQPWVSLSQLTQTTHDRNILAAYILNALCSTLPHTE